MSGVANLLLVRAEAKLTAGQIPMIPGAAQSRELPVPYSCPAKIISGTPDAW